MCTYMGQYMFVHIYIQKVQARRRLQSNQPVPPPMTGALTSINHRVVPSRALWGGGGGCSKFRFSSDLNFNISVVPTCPVPDFLHLQTSMGRPPQHRFDRRIEFCSATGCLKEDQHVQLIKSLALNSPLYTTHTPQTVILKGPSVQYSYAPPKPVLQFLLPNTQVYA